MAWVIPSCKAGQQQSETAKCTAVKIINITLGAGDNGNQSSHCKIKTNAEKKAASIKEESNNDTIHVFATDIEMLTREKA